MREAAVGGLLIMRLRQTLLLLCWLVLALVSPPIHAQRVKPAYESNIKVVRTLLEQPESQLDLASIKLAIDEMIEPATDKAAVLKQLDGMASEIRASFPLEASNLVKFKTLRDYLYRPPLLSGRRPFAYNLEDDRNPKAKLLSVYLATHKGNCVSMPLLFVILGQKLGIPVTITTAPAHLYVKFRGDNGNWYGVETTSGGGWADDDWQRKQFPRLTEKAIANGIYLQPLTKRETAVVIADSLLEYYEHQHSVEANQARVKLALLQLDHYLGNSTALGSSLTDYLQRQSALRDTAIVIVPTTPDQEKRILDYFRQFGDPNAGINYSETCAARTAKGLSAADLLREAFVTSPQTYGFPYSQYQAVRNLPGALTVVIPNGGSVPSFLATFNPR
ncbi:transglutaminase family protein [Caenimonas koreensis]|nr:transglutaminase family protein [Caenimonas koreensis]